MKVIGSLETALHVDDLSWSVGFYRRLLENERMVALIVADRNVLLLFLTGGSTQPIAVPGRVIPPHGGSGHLHPVFSIAAGEVEPCRHRLESVAVAVEGEVTWPCGAGGLDFREPYGHLVELIRPGFRSICWSAQAGSDLRRSGGREDRRGLIKAEKITYVKANQLYG